MKITDIINRQNGGAMILALIGLAVGGLLVASFLTLASTSLKISSNFESSAKRQYAAEAGMEYAIWGLQTRSVAEFSADVPDTDLVINDCSVGVDINLKDIDPVTAGIQQPKGKRLYTITSTAQRDGKSTTVTSDVGITYDVFSFAVIALDGDITMPLAAGEIDPFIYGSPAAKIDEADIYARDVDTGDGGDEGDIELGVNAGGVSIRGDASAMGQIPNNQARISEWVTEGALLVPTLDEQLDDMTIAIWGEDRTNDEIGGWQDIARITAPGTNPDTPTEPVDPNLQTNPETGNTYGDDWDNMQTTVVNPWGTTYGNQINPGNSTYPAGGATFTNANARLTVGVGVNWVFLVPVPVLLPWHTFNGPATFGGNLVINGGCRVTFNGPVDIAGSLTINGLFATNVVFNGPVEIGGNLTIASGCTVQFNDTTDSNYLYIGGNYSCTSALLFSNTTIFECPVKIDGNYTQSATLALNYAYFREQNNITVDTDSDLIDIGGDVSIAAAGGACRFWTQGPLRVGDTVADHFDGAVAVGGIDVRLARDISGNLIADSPLRVAGHLDMQALILGAVAGLVAGGDIYCDTGYFTVGGVGLFACVGTVDTGGSVYADDYFLVGGTGLAAGSFVDIDGTVWAEGNTLVSVGAQTNNGVYIGGLGIANGSITNIGGSVYSGGAVTIGGGGVLQANPVTIGEEFYAMGPVLIGGVGIGAASDVTIGESFYSGGAVTIGGGGFAIMSDIVVSGTMIALGDIDIGGVGGFSASTFEVGKALYADGDLTIGSGGLLIGTTVSVGSPCANLTPGTPCTPIYIEGDLEMGQIGSGAMATFDDSVYVGGDVTIDGFFTVPVLGGADLDFEDTLYAGGDIEVGTIVGDSHFSADDIVYAEGSVSFEGLLTFNDSWTIGRMIIAEQNINLTSDPSGVPLPTDFIPLYISTNGNITFDEFFHTPGLLYAPEGTVNIIGSDNYIYGCVIGKDVNIQAGAPTAAFTNEIEFPEDLRDRARDLPGRHSGEETTDIHGWHIAE